MTENKRQLNLVDGLVLIVFLLFSILFFLAKFQSNSSFIVLSGDGGNLVSFAAAQDRPDLFSGDPALGESNRTGYYATIHIPLIRALSHLTGGDYVYAFLLALAPTVLIQLTGFYILGRVLFHNRFYAFLLALLTAMPFSWNGLGEFWGLWAEPLPRMTYQAVLPYLLALVVIWRNQPRRWPWLMVIAGLMVFLHSISAPTIGFSIWLGLWLYLPSGWKPLRKLGTMLGLGLVFLAAISPFAINFLGYRSRGASANYDLVMKIIETYQPPYLLNAPGALSLFATQVITNLLLPLAAAGFFALWKFGKAERNLMVMVLTWFSGVLLMSVGLPTLERVIEGAFHILPVDTELLRGMRYLVPLMQIFWLWPLAEFSARFTRPGILAGLALVGILATGSWTISYPPQGRQMLDTVACIVQGKLTCGNDPDLNELYGALQQTPPRSRVWFFSDSQRGSPLTLAVRYLALRPLVYTTVDAGLFIYTNQTYLESWMATTQQVEAIQALADPVERMERILPLARELKAEYLALDFAIDPKKLDRFPVEVIMRNSSFLLIRIKG